MTSPMRKILLLLPLIVLSACEMPAQQKSAVKLPEPESAGVAMMKEFCASCHAPPSPTVHTAEEWPNVIYRMQERRRMEAYELMNDDERGTLLEYLKRQAKVKNDA